MRDNVLDFAAGPIIGAAFGTIVNSQVKDIVNPIAGLFPGGVDFSNVFIPLDGKYYGTLDAATVDAGLLVNACISFPIVAAVIFTVIETMSK